MAESEPLADLAREDCLVRVGALLDSDMVARRVATLEETTRAFCAAAGLRHCAYAYTKYSWLKHGRLGKSHVP